MYTVRPFGPYVIMACGFHKRSVKTNNYCFSKPSLDENLRENPFSCWMRASYRASPFSYWMYPYVTEPTLFRAGCNHALQSQPFFMLDVKTPPSSSEPALFHAGWEDVIPINDYPLCHTLLCSLSPESSLSIITPSCEGPHQACHWSNELHLGQRLGQHIRNLLICGNVLELPNSLVHPITDMFFVSSVECHTRLLPTMPRNHRWSQVEATSWGAFLVSDTTGPIWICIANQSKFVIRSIPEAIMNRTLSICFPAIKWTYLGSTIYWLKVFTTKHIYGLVFIKYINEPIICLYMMASTFPDVVSPNNFRFVVIGVVMDLQSIVPNLLKISTTYFSWLNIIPLGFCHTSRPKKLCMILRSFISNFVASFLFRIKDQLLFTCLKHVIHVYQQCFLISICNLVV